MKNIYLLRKKLAAFSTILALVLISMAWTLPFSRGNTAEASSTLFVDISANPSFGNAPLNGVDLTAANVSGSASGPITYYFDCTNDGSWEKIVTTNDTSYTAQNLCNYSSSGNYTAAVKVERGGLSFAGTTAIAVTNNSNSGQSLTVNKLGRNLTTGEISWHSQIQAKPSNRLAFRIEVRTNNGSVNNVIVSDALPNQLNYAGNLAVNGSNWSGDITSGVNIGDLAANETKILTFEAEVKPENYFPLGTTLIVNAAIARAQNIVVTSDILNITIQRGSVLGAATEVNTAATDYIVAITFMSFITALAIYFSWRRMLVSDNKLAKVIVKKYHFWKSMVIPR